MLLSMYLKTGNININTKHYNTRCYDHSVYTNALKTHVNDKKHAGIQVQSPWCKSSFDALNRIWYHILRPNLAYVVMSQAPSAALPALPYKPIVAFTAIYVLFISSNWIMFSWLGRRAPYISLGCWCVMQLTHTGTLPKFALCCSNLLIGRWGGEDQGWVWRSGVSSSRCVQVFGVGL